MPWISPGSSSSIVGRLPEIEHSTRSKINVDILSLSISLLLSLSLPLSLSPSLSLFLLLIPCYSYFNHNISLVSGKCPHCFFQRLTGATGSSCKNSSAKLWHVRHRLTRFSFSLYWYCSSPFISLRVLLLESFTPVVCACTCGSCLACGHIWLRKQLVHL